MYIKDKMSESSSFTFSIPNDSLYYFNINMKMCAILLFIILFCIFMSSMTASLMPRPHRYYLEPYSNEEMGYSYQNIKYTNYSRTGLTSPEGSLLQQNIATGTALRIVTHKNNDLHYNLNIDANLYILGGNIYNKENQKSIDQNYIAQVINPKTKQIFELGPLIKDNDGIYKIKYSINTNNIPSIIGTLDNLLNFNIVRVLHVIKNPETKAIVSSNIVIEGDLNKMV